VNLGESVRALMSARAGGVSQAPYDACNLGDHVGDDPVAVSANRAKLAAHMHAEPVWLTQVHGNRVVRLSRTPDPADPDRVCLTPGAPQPEADGAFTTEPGLACTVMVADCLPILLAAPGGRGVAALHAGWRGLAGAGAMQGQGIVHTGVAALCAATGCAPGELRAWLGPCIGPQRFEVGAVVLRGFGRDPDQGAGDARFVPGAPGKWLADLPGLARDILQTLGVQDICGDGDCTVSDASRFFSFRRDPVTGRQAASICLR
jgi:YfiH family protein